MALDLCLYGVAPEAIADFQEHSVIEFSDPGRCANTLDFLLQKYARLKDISIPDAVLWHGGTMQPLPEGGDGETSVYSNSEMTAINEALQQIDAQSLLKMYNYEELTANKVYKVTRPENLEFLGKTYDEMKLFFTQAFAGGLVIVKRII
jgi:hypothetical protein